ncbi:MAG: hypothetical protein HOM58_17190 [Rhodospirillaceae bacterium]|jgi:hypothetical protein|nr:hypothetical protein [Rhodospirillaceae bacterium]MBT5459794.1 hypothetical protein [Rhodospirillaceae bacterium]
MFKVGDTVRNVAANAVGVVVEIDGDTIYLEQDNGCEVDFQVSALVLESAFQAKHDTSVRDDAGSHVNDPVYDSVISNLYPAIMEMGQRTHGQVKPVPGVTAKSWDGLSALQKLNAISEATDVPVKNWIDANRTGAKPSLATLQLSVLADSGKKP